MLYSVLKFIVKCLMIPFVKIEVQNIEKIPPEGPVLLASNHVSNWDPVILAIALPRKLHFMAKEELFKIFIIGSIIRKLGTFPVKRGAADRNAIRESLKVLNENKVLCIFPEGTRGKPGKLLPFQPGVTLIAHKANAPLVPIGLSGTNNILVKGLRVKVKLLIGDPIYPAQLAEGKMSSEQLEEITAALQNKVNDLLIK
ncbi:MAG: 1-acyl-sn-glycerol-3-phosphate acyltransferase [Clostridia bacterium]|nr:1-acyl-sn-glycerol-3-phosphate acyltransferase [Clostridia bacterium]